MRGTIVSALAALVALTLAGLAQFNAGVLDRLLGPPAVTLSETYADDSGGATFDHSGLDALLERYVNEHGGVDYEGLKMEESALARYINAIADAPFAGLSRDGKLALLINAYNAFTLQLILEHVDEDLTSIRDIPSAQRWDAVRWNIGGKKFSLNEIEHGEIRPKFTEPNVHWALVCAAVGCPPLRGEAYTEKKLHGQLEDQAKIVHTDGSRWLRFEEARDKIHLTKIYDWYGGDFAQVSGTILSYVARYFEPLGARLEDAESIKVEWLSYDWALNSEANLS